jgi:ATP-binding cassette subfamily B protein
MNSEKRPMNNHKEGLPINQKPNPDGRPPIGPMGPMGGPGRGPMGGPGPGGPMAMMMKGVKAKDLKGTLKKLALYLKPFKILLVIVFIFAIISTIFNIVGPKILGQATTTLYEGVLAQISGVGGIDFDKIGRIILICMILYVLSALFGYIQGWIMANISTSISYRLRQEISVKMNKIPLKYFDNTTHGDVLSRITNDVDTLNQNISQSVTQIITSLVTVVGILIMMFSISWQMTLIALVMLPLSGMLIGLVVGKSQKYFKGQQKYLGMVNGHVEEMYSGHIVMKAFNGEEKSMQKFTTYNNSLYDSAWKAQFISAAMMPLMILVGNLGYVAVVIMGSYLMIRNTIKIGDIQAFVQYVRSFNQPIQQLANISNVLQQTAAAAERVFEFLEVKEEVPDTPTPVKLEQVKGAVEFKGIQFGYTPEKIVIKNFSAKTLPGQKIAIVGPTGAGKTTIVKLLMRFYDISSGEILIDGNNIQNFTRRDLRKKLAMVLQDTWLFNGTIMENIRYGKPGASDDEVIAAAKAAHVDDFIHAFPEGYNMVLNEETNNLSQGQMQLITIARAVLANPPILILDEATSSVDTRTEILIQQAMDNLMKNRTSFVIAHRLSTIRNADLILVLRDGDIVEQGTHKELLAKAGFYAELHNSQFEVINGI